MRQEPLLRPLDAGLMLSLLLLHPALYHAGQTAWAFKPDALAYITMGRDLFASGLLYLPDADGGGVILPPLYPVLIALGQMVSRDLLAVSEWIAWGVSLLSCLPLFLLIARRAGRGVAWGAVLFMQINFHLVDLAFVPLTEPLFILFSALSLLLMDGKPQRLWISLLLGMMLALTFMSRQIGVLLLPYALAMVPRRGLVAAGFFLLVAPYGMLLYQQTGHSPLQQHFSPPGEEMAEDGVSQEKIRRILGAQPRNYQEELSQRRRLLQLTPDATRMLADLPTARGERQRPVVEKVMDRFLKDPLRVWERIRNNMGTLKEFMGWPLLVVLGLALLSSAWHWRRGGWSVAGFVLLYFLTVSFITDRVERYMVVLVPFAVAAVALEVGRWVGSRGLLGGALGGVLLAGMVATTPKTFLDLELSPRQPEERIPLTRLRKVLPPGAPLYSIHPFYSFLAGGRHRTLPNDALAQVIRHARHTGVEWLLLARSPPDQVEIARYGHSPWLKDSHLDQRYRSWLTLEAQVEGGYFQLYRITLSNNG